MTDLDIKCEGRRLDNDLLERFMSERWSGPDEDSIVRCSKHGKFHNCEPCWDCVDEATEVL